MTPKKNPKADLERKRPLFFLIGASLALMVAMFVLQLKTAYETPVLTADMDIEEPYSPAIPVTQTAGPKIPKPKEIYKADPDILNIVEEIIERPILNETLLLDGGEGDTELKEIEVFLLDEEIDTIPVFIVERMAVPKSCAHLHSKSEQWDCLNEWLSHHIPANMKYPGPDARMGNEGTVLVHFLVSETGKMEMVYAKSGEHPGLNEEAVRVVSEFPEFRPAMNNGRAVKMSMDIPVNFKLH